MGFGMLGGMFFIWIILIVLAVFVVRGLFQSNSPANDNRNRDQLSAREILEQRYARGEITQDQFLQMRKDL
jgi:putative membrane protein